MPGSLSPALCTMSWPNSLDLIRGRRGNGAVIGITHILPLGAITSGRRLALAALPQFIAAILGGADQVGQFIFGKIR